MLSVLTFLFEGITIWICLHIVFGGEIKIRLSDALFLLCYVGFYTLCSFNVISKSFVLIFVPLMFLYCYKIFGQTLLQTFLRFILASVLLGYIETTVMLVFFALIENSHGGYLQYYLMMSFCTALIASLVYLKLKKDNLRIDIISLDKNLMICVGIACIFLICIKYDSEMRRSIMVAIYLMTFIVLAIAFMEIFRQKRTQFELEKKEVELSLQKVYDEAYQELLDEMRRKQHDYKNQLTALYSIHLTANSMEELIERQKEYGEMLQKGNSYDSILTGCNNPVLAGYIYSMCVRFEKDGIIIQPEIKVQEREYRVSIADIIEALGVLLNNAYESLMEQNDVEKRIKLKILEKNSELYIEVKNASRYIPHVELEKMFQLGASTKGENRGIGLYSLKKMVLGYKGELQVENIEDQGENWLDFKVSISLS